MADAGSTVREYMDTWNRRDWKRYRDMMHSDYSYTGGDGRTLSGPDAGIAVGQMFANAFPDGRIAIKRVHTTGNTAIVEFEGRGTHEGDFMGVRPTNRKVTIPVCNVIEIRDGKIFAEREYMDMAHMLQQLGVTTAQTRA